MNISLEDRILLNKLKDSEAEMFAMLARINIELINAIESREDYELEQNESGGETWTH